MFPTVLSQKSKRNTLEAESQTVSLGRDESRLTYTDRCPFYDSFTLCPFSWYCFSVISVFEFRGTPIDASDPALTTRCTDTNEAGEFTIFVH